MESGQQSDGLYYILSTVKKIFYIALLLLVILVWRDWDRREIVHSPGVLVPEAPRQARVAGPVSFEFKGYQLTRRAAFDIRARVLSREDYRWGAETELSPMDLALGWGVMSDQAVLDRIEISQRSRWYFTKYDLPAPIPDPAIISHSSNMHMVPANDWVLSKLRDIRHGDVIRAKGFLIDVDHESGFRWRTSLSRNDTGNGSCELFYIERIEIEPKI